MTSARRLLLAGAGGLAREAAETVRAINTVAPTWDLVGFLDDDPAKAGRLIAGLPIVGPMAAVHDDDDCLVLLCPVRPDNYTARARLAERLELPDQRYATVVHPTASIGASCSIGVGSLVLGHVDLTAGVSIGRHVIVMPQVVLPHDVVVDDWATLASGVRCGGSVHISRGAYVGAGALIRENLTIGPWSLTGMGAIVTRDVPGERVWFGSPARDRGPAPLPARSEASR